MGVSVMVMRELQEDALIFTMAHELKHHLVDSTLEIRSQWEFEEPNPIETGAEIFASELIYPEPDFRSDVERMGINRSECSAKIIRRLKRKTQTTLPYEILAERAVKTGFAPKNALQKWETRDVSR